MVKELIWKELWQAKFSEQYALLTCSFYKKISKWIDIVIVALSGTGTVGGFMGLGFWKSGVILPLIACAVISIIQIIKPLLAKILPTDKQLVQLYKISDFYYNYHICLEKLWFNAQVNNIVDKELLEQYYKIKEMEKEITKDINEALDHEIERIRRKAHTETMKHFGQFKNN